MDYDQDQGRAGDSGSDPVRGLRIGEGALGW
jgi:hypothetical protein